MTRVEYTDEFKDDIKHIKNKDLRWKIKKAIKKIGDNPNVGKPLRYKLKGCFSVRVPPFRIIYEIEGEVVWLHKFDHRDGVYGK